MKALDSTRENRSPMIGAHVPLSKLYGYNFEELVFVAVSSEPATRIVDWDTRREDVMKTDDGRLIYKVSLLAPDEDYDGLPRMEPITVSVPANAAGQAPGSEITKFAQVRLVDCVVGMYVNKNRGTGAFTFSAKRVEAIRLSASVTPAARPADKSA